MMLIAVETIARSAYWIHINITGPPEDEKDKNPRRNEKAVLLSLIDLSKTQTRNHGIPAKSAFQPQMNAAMHFYEAQVKFERVSVWGKSRKICVDFLDFYLAK